MSLLKRHIGRRRHAGRRVLGVIVGASLLVLGLEAPAFAAPPSITSFTPTSGPGGCVVQINGDHFTDQPVLSVDFGGVPALNFQVISNNEIWAAHPAGASGFITVANVEGPGSSTTPFTQATPGGCAPTVTSFTPMCGPPGTEVTVSGSNLMASSTVGAAVIFAPIPPGVVAPETAPPTTPTLTERTVAVPAGAGNGSIAVLTFVTSAFSANTFAVGTCITDVSPTQGAEGTPVTITGVGFDNVTQVQFFNGIPAPFTLVSNTGSTDVITTTVPLGAATGPITLFTADAPNGTSVSTATDFTIGAPNHSRNVTLKLKKHLVARGKVVVPDGFTACAVGVTVKIQRRKSGSWKTVGKDTTNSNGVYRDRIRDKQGRYRAVAKKVTLGSGDICLKDVSPKRRHSH